MTPLPQIKQELKDSLPLGIDITLQTLKNYLPERAAKYNEVVLLESRYQAAHQALLRGTVDNKETTLEFNRIREALLLFIDELEEDDFEEQDPTQSKPKPQRGNILYRIPDTMKVDQETKCLVRIAFSKEVLLEALTLEDADVIQSIRVSEVMGVILIDPNENAPFKIRTFSETIQLIYKDDYTEWVFYVKPLQVGEFSLLLKVSVVEIRDGKERKRDIVLEEKVVITTEAVEPVATTFKSADYSLVTGGTVAQAVKNPSHPMPSGLDQPTIKIKNKPAPPKSNPAQKRIKLFKRATGSLAALLLLVIASYALIPGVRTETDWLWAKYWHTKDSYQNFIKKHQTQKSPSQNLKQKMRQAEQAIDRIEYTKLRADSTANPTIGFWEKYPNGTFAPLIKEHLTWLKALKTDSPLAVSTYITIYGEEGQYTKKADSLLEYREREEAIRDSIGTEAEDYLNKYPNGTFAPLINERLDWLTALKDTSTLSVSAYLNTYKEKGKYKEKADSLLEHREYEEAMRDSTSAEAKDYLNKYPNGTFVPLIKEQLTWLNALKNNTITAFSTYITTYGNDGKYSQEAKKRLEELQNNSKKTNANPSNTTNNPKSKNNKTIDKKTSPPTNKPSQKQDKADIIVEKIAQNMVFVEKGSFKIGCTQEQGGDCDPNETPSHKVKLNSFYIAKYETTFEEYDAFCEATGRSKPNDKGWGRGKRPAINVSWNDAVAYCQWLSKKTGQKYRLPTEAEWEFAARGGNKSRQYKYAGSNNIANVAWYNDNGSRQTHTVGQKQANELDLYDMSGNVGEWCSDWYEAYSNRTQNNPKGARKGTERVLRGGSWLGIHKRCRVSDRLKDVPNDRFYDFGFRIARSN